MVSIASGYKIAGNGMHFLMLLVIALGWFAVGCIYVLETILLRRYDLNSENNIQARRVHTQFQLFRRMLIGFVVIVDIGATIPPREPG